MIPPESEAVPKILFVARAFPPLVGGLERQNFELSRALGGLLPVTTFANRRGKKFLPLFLTRSLLYAWRSNGNHDLLLLGDALLAPLGALLRRFSGKPAVAVAHGLDVTYRPFGYQKGWLGWSLRHLDAVIAVSRHTQRECLARGVKPERLFTIPNGVVPPMADVDSARLRLGWLGAEKRKGRKILLTVGRLRKRKGVRWFVEAVMPRLPADCIYVIAGSGPDKEQIHAAIRRMGLSDRLNLLGAVSEEEKAYLFSLADLFVQPNIPVPGDVEGFGIGALEAAASGLPVVASDLEGLQDAIQEGENGLRVRPLDDEQFADRITRLLHHEAERRRLGEKARRYTLERYGWDRIAGRYRDVLCQLAFAASH